MRGTPPHVAPFAADQIEVEESSQYRVIGPGTRFPEHLGSPHGHAPPGRDRVPGLSADPQPGLLKHPGWDLHQHAFRDRFRRLILRSRLAPERQTHKQEPELLFHTHPSTAGTEDGCGSWFSRNSAPNKTKSCHSIPGNQGPLSLESKSVEADGQQNSVHE